MSQIPFACPKFTVPLAAPITPNAKSIIASFTTDAESALSSMRIQIGQKGLFVRRSSQGVFLRKIWKIEQATGGAETSIDWAARVGALLSLRSNIHWVEQRNPESDRFITIAWNSKPTIWDCQVRMALLDLEWERRNKAAQKAAEAEAELAEQADACASDRTDNCA